MNAEFPVAYVAFPAGQGFDYAVPEALREVAVAGAAVLVPLGTRKLIGYIIERRPQSAHPLKPIERMATEVPAIPPDVMRLAFFVANYYLVSVSDVLRMVVPTPMRRKLLRHYKLSKSGKSLASADPEHPLNALRRLRTPQSLRKALKLSAKEMARQLDEWVAAGFAELKETLSVGGGDDAEPGSAAAHQPSQFTPRAEQAAALEALRAAVDANSYQGFLLWGVTGSGKTEVYLAAIAHALALDKTAIVLVPEIGLTPQLEARFRARFGDDVVTIHSGLTVSQKRAAWNRVQAGAARVVVGPRSALFAPLDKLGVIIVDEEHDDSYKQDETPRYHARDVALVRAQFAKAVCVLGSATPSLETLGNAERGKLGLLRMRERATGGSLPIVELVRIGEKQDPNKPPEWVLKSGRDVQTFTPRLTELVLETVARNEQVILFLNRRGYAPYVMCQGCSYGFKCESCSVSLTHHLKRQVLMCHYCGHTEPLPLECPSCKGVELRIVGAGTERLETEMLRAFPNVRIGRLDRDVAERTEDLERTLQRFRAHELDVLVGTQMVTKGHDFPNVTLVGVLAADSGLNFPDFRAAERTAQLLIQVGGRAGRADKPGRVVVQTHSPEHIALRAAATHDYETFAKQELVDRQALGYPPYSRLILFRVEDEQLATAEQHAKQLGELLRKHGIEVLGPAPCPLARIQGQYRLMLLAKSQSHEKTRAGVRQALHELPALGTAKLVVDVDPVSML